MQSLDSTPSHSLLLAPASHNEQVQSAITHQSLPVLVEAQVALCPSACAVWQGGRQLSYQDLNMRANQLAHYLRQQGVGIEERVGVCLPRSLELIVSLLAILKVGAAYV